MQSIEQTSLLLAVYIVCVVVLLFFFRFGLVIYSYHGFTLLV